MLPATGSIFACSVEQMPWGQEVSLRDLDGNRLRIGATQLTDRGRGRAGCGCPDTGIPGQDTAIECGRLSFGVHAQRRAGPRASHLRRLARRYHDGARGGRARVRGKD